MSQVVSRCISRLAAGLLLLVLPGCGSSDDPSAKRTNSTTEAPLKLRVLVVDDETLAAALEQQWSTRAIDDQLQIRNATSDQLQSAKRLSADVVIFPADWMGELVERELIQPIPARGVSEGDDSIRTRSDDWFTTIRQCDTSWGRNLYAVPLGSPQLVLLYRPDIFARLDIKPPESWAEYQTVVEKLRDRAAIGDLVPADSPWQPALEPTAAQWASKMLLARAASAVRVEGQVYTLFNADDQMTPRIATAPYVRTAQEMSTALKLDAELPRRSPAEVRQEFLAGHCGMAVTWPTADTAESKTPIAFAELPGGSDYFSFQESAWSTKKPGENHRVSLCGVSGRLAAVTREARRSASAFQFLTWLASEETSQSIAPASIHTTPFGTAHVDRLDDWLGSMPAKAASEYGEVLQSAFDRTTWMSDMRLPAAREYHAALDEAVWQSLADADKAQQAFDEAARKWSDISKRFDISKHRRAYQRSLGNDF